LFWRRSIDRFERNGQCSRSFAAFPANASRVRPLSPGSPHRQGTLENSTCHRRVSDPRRFSRGRRHFSALTQWFSSIFLGPLPVFSPRNTMKTFKKHTFLRIYMKTWPATHSLRNAVATRSRVFWRICYLKRLVVYKNERESCDLYDVTDIFFIHICSILLLTWLTYQWIRFVSFCTRERCLLIARRNRTSTTSHRHRTTHNCFIEITSRTVNCATWCFLTERRLLEILLFTKFERSKTVVIGRFPRVHFPTFWWYFHTRFPVWETSFCPDVKRTEGVQHALFSETRCK